MPDALLMVISVALLYTLFILLTATIMAKHGKNASRMVFMQLAVMYLLCLVALTVLPTKMSDRTNNFVPLIAIKSCYLSGGAFGVINYLSHQALNIIMYIPFGVFVSVATHLTTSSNMAKNSLIAGLIVVLVAEAIQILIPYRAAETDDFIFGVVGVLVGSAILIKNLKSVWVKKRLSNILR